jgi:predicted transcriptional regulator of viral defense system
MPRSLSPLESKLILFLEWEKKPFLTTKQAMDILSISPDYIRVLLHRLVQKGWSKKGTRGQDVAKSAFPLKTRRS